MPDTRIDTASTGSLIVESDSVAVAAELTAVIVAVTDGQPRVLTIERGQALPSGPFEPVHRSLQAGLRSWVETQTHHPLIMSSNSTPSRIRTGNRARLAASCRSAIWV